MDRGDWFVPTPPRYEEYRQLQASLEMKFREVRILIGRIEDMTREDPRLIHTFYGGRTYGEHTYGGFMNNVSGMVEYLREKLFVFVQWQPERQAVNGQTWRDHLE